MLLNKRALVLGIFGTLLLLTTDGMRGELQNTIEGVPDGLWTSRGYGLVLNVSNGSTIVLEETSVSCIVSDDLYSYVETMKVDDDNVLTVTATGALQPFVFDRTDAFEGGCVNGITPTITDENYVRNAHLDFDTLDQTFVEHYAFFGLRGVDWETSSSKARATLTSDSSDDQLLEAFASMLGPLKDGHVFVGSEDGQYAFESKAFEVLVQLQEEFEQQDAMADLETYINAQLMTWIQIITRYMDSGGLNGQPGTFVWGRFKDANVGYMQLLAFDPEDDAFFVELDSAFVNLKDVDTMIFDIRVNVGGSDEVALGIASHFTSERVFALTERAVDGDNYTTAIEGFIEPGENPAAQFDGEAIVIISGSSVSAAEVFTLAMAQLPQTTLLGRNTSGDFSDILPRKLPNGWFFGLSNEIYAGPDGTVYEAVGIVPDILPEAELLPLSERQAGIDSWLQLALETATMEAESPTKSPTTERPSESPISESPITASTSDADRAFARWTTPTTLWIIISIVWAIPSLA